MIRRWFAIRTAAARLRAANAVFRSAYYESRAATETQDTRRMHVTALALRAAQNERITAELALHDAETTGQRRVAA